MLAVACGKKRREEERFDHQQHRESAVSVKKGQEGNVIGQIMVEAEQRHDSVSHWV